MFHLRLRWIADIGESVRHNARAVCDARLVAGLVIVEPVIERISGSRVVPTVARVEPGPASSPG